MKQHSTIVSIAIVVSSLVCISAGSGFVSATDAHVSVAKVINPSPLDIPPTGFNPLVASTKQLEQYGFPPRPTSPKRLAIWTTAMQHAKQYVAPEQAPSRVTHAVATGNWAGYVLQSSSSASKFNDVSSSWSVPSWNEGPDLTGADPSFWVGVGTSKIVQAGIDIGANNNGQSKQYEFWVEDYPQGAVYQLRPSVTGGDNVYVDVFYNGTTSQAYLENETTGEYTTVFFSSPKYSGATADYIYEAVAGRYVNWGSTNFSYAQLEQTSGSGELIDYSPTEYVMYDNFGLVVGQPSALNDSTDGFSVTSQNGE